MKRELSNFDKTLIAAVFTVCFAMLCISVIAVAGMVSEKSIEYHTAGTVGQASQVKSSTNILSAAAPQQTTQLYAYDTSETAVTESATVTTTDTASAVVSEGMATVSQSEVSASAQDTQAPLPTQVPLAVSEPPIQTLPPRTSPPTQAVKFPININTATAEELMALNGIGEKKAAAIIEYRNTYGAFASIEDLTKVSGIGAKTLEVIRAYITVGE